MRPSSARRPAAPAARLHLGFSRRLSRGLVRGLLRGLLGLVFLACAACEEDRARGEGERSGPSTAAAAGGPVPGDEPKDPAGGPFEEITAEVGLDFVHFNGMSGGYYYSEMMGSGGALFDADGDGDLDLYLVQGGELGGVAAEDSAFPPAESMHPLRDRLYRNDLQLDDEGTGEIRFADVTAESGIDSRGYGMGVAAADFDADGHPDLYVTRHGDNAHWRNRGDGTFEEVADETSRLGGWSVPAVPADLDLDGDVDLFVGRYVRYSTDDDRQCSDELGQRNYCGPLAYPPMADAILWNRGDGTFERDPELEAPLGSSFGPALGALATDLTGDGRIDVFVANDGSENQLWTWTGDGLRDVALLAGVAVNGRGLAEASMGVDAADLEQDGAEDLFVTHLTRETNTLYLGHSFGQGDGGVEENAFEGNAFEGNAFEGNTVAGLVDRSAESGLGAPSFDRTGFGTRFVDWDLDGDLDVAVVNGAVKVIKELALAGDPYPLHQRNQLFENVGSDGKLALEGLAFEEIDAGAWSEASEVSRAAIFGDLDQDGDADVVVTNNAGPARVFRNVAGDGKAWLGVELVESCGDASAGNASADNGCTTAALHAVARLGDLRLRVQTAAGYASSQDPRLVFPLVDETSSEHEVGVRWTDGGEEVFRGLGVGRYHRLVRGTGERP